MMKILNITFFLSLIFSNPVFSQKNNTAHFINSYDVNNGFKVHYVNDMFFDQHDWLWISGKTLNSEQKQLSNASVIIQRFDGNQFYTLEFPDEKLKNYNQITLKQQPNGNLLALFSKNYDHILYTINVSTLKFKIVNVLNTIGGNISRHIQLFKSKDNFFLIDHKNKQSDIYEISSELKLKLKFNHKNPTKAKQHFTNLFLLQKKLIFRSLREGTLSFNNTTKKKKWLTKEDFDLNHSFKNDKKRLYLDKTFYYKDTLHALLNINKKYYKYIESIEKWKPTQLYDVTEEMEIRSLKNKGLIKMTYTPNGINFKRSKHSLFFKDSFSLPIFSGNVLTSTRDIDKELFVANNGKLYHIILNNNLVSNYLIGYSIRNIYPITSKKYLVGTVSNGWFTLDLNTSTTLPFNVTLNNKPYKPTINRGFQLEGETLWSNNSNGIVEANFKTRDLTSYIHYPVSCMYFDSTDIYYGTINYNLMRFNKDTRRNIKIVATDTLDILDIIKTKNKVYAASDKGLLIYDTYANTKTFNKLPNQSSYFISLDYSQEFGILIGSKDGKLYTYNDKSQTFKLLFKDDFKSSIVSATSLDKNTLWINTFLGSIRYNTLTKDISRFGEAIGFTNNEANRYSFYKAKDSTFLLGTIDGLNVFNPYELENINNALQLEISEIGIYNKKKKLWQTYTAPKTIDSLKNNTNLAAENSRLSIALKNKGIQPVNKVDYYYKLDNNNWELMNFNRIDFAQLNSGFHKISFKAQNKTFSSKSNVITLNATANSFIYQKWWFYPAIILLLLTIGSFYYKELIERKNVQQKLSQGLIKAQETERARIAMELHDDIGQHLSLLSRKSKSSNNKELQKLAEDSLQKLRIVSQGLFPTEIKNQGFTNALITMIDIIDANTMINFMRDIDHIDHYISANQGLQLYRIIQEILTNSVKHAQATSIEIYGYLKNKKVIFKISDNGKGFNFTKEKNNTLGGLGMKSIFERAKIINAKINITSEINLGTKYTITLINFSKKNA